MKSFISYHRKRNNMFFLLLKFYIGDKTSQPERVFKKPEYPSIINFQSEGTLSKKILLQE